MTAGRLTRWDTPFTDTTFPAVSLLTDPEVFNRVHLVVAPAGINKYPKYLVSFQPAVAFKVEDESFPTDVEYRRTQDVKGVCACECLDSVWVRSFDPSATVVEAYYSNSLRHFIVLGGDVNAEVLSTEEPEITEISGPRTLWHHAV